MKNNLSESIGKSYMCIKNDLIYQVSNNLLKLIGYKDNEILGKSTRELSVLLKMDYQIYLEDIKEKHNLYIFTKEGLAIDITITCEFSIKENIKIYYFKENTQVFLENMLLNLNDFSISKKHSLAVYSCPDCICLKMNEEYINNLNLIDFTYDDPIGKPYAYQKYISKLIEEGGSFYKEEVEFISSNGIASYWDISLKVINGDGNQKFLLSSLYNVSDRVIERKTNDKSKIEMELILENISDVITKVNNKGDFIYVNKAGVDKLNPYTAEVESLDDKIQYELFTYRDIEGKKLSYEETPIQRVLRGEQIIKEIFVGTSHLPTTYHECIGIPIYDNLGNIERGILTYRDIGDRIEAEKERIVKKEKELQTEILEARLFKSQRERINKIIEAQEIEFIRCTYPDLEIISINGNALKSIKKMRNSMGSKYNPVGENFNTIYPIHKTSKIKEWRSILVEEDYSHIDYTEQIIDGNKRNFKTINQPMFGENNKIVEVIFITTDITKEVEDKNKVEDTLEMQNQMFSTISHELKTPLSVIFSAVQLMEIYLKKEALKIDKEDINKNLIIIKQNCYRFTKLINNIIDLSSIESGFYVLNFKNRNIVEVVEDIIHSVRGYLGDKSLNITFDTQIEELITAVDVDKIERIILNLISNSVKFSFENGNIYIEIIDKDDFVEILIRDFGEGIDEKDLSTIFNKYKRVDNSLSRKAEGSGIGLSLVKTMVELMGGEISVESELGKGSLFTVRLPINLLDESDIIDIVQDSNNRIEKLNIEFSDLY